MINPLFHHPPQIDPNLVLQVIAAVLLGGVSFMGGTGNITNRMITASVRSLPRLAGRPQAVLRARFASSSPRTIRPRDGYAPRERHDAPFVLASTSCRTGHSTRRVLSVRARRISASSRAVVKQLPSKPSLFSGRWRTLWVPETRFACDHAAALYSWMSPPSTSPRRTRSRATTVFAPGGDAWLGGRCWRERWGRCSL